MALDTFAGIWDDKYLQGIHHKCPRVAEKRNPCSHQKAQSVPYRLLAAKSDLSGDQRCVEKMEYADPELTEGDESFYYQVR